MPCHALPGDYNTPHTETTSTVSGVIDVQGAHCDVNGVLRHDHGTVRLTYDAVRDLRDLLEQLAEPIETRQEPLPGIWGNAAHAMKPMPSRFRRRA